jgi:hypothetical protein
VNASLGLIRISHRFKNRQDPQSRADQITEAALAGRHLRWALFAEWYANPVSLAQTMRAPVPPTLPIEIAYTKQQYSDVEASNAEAKTYADLVARSSRGTLVEFEHVDHEHLMDPSPILDPMIARIKQLSKESAP